MSMDELSDTGVEYHGMEIPSLCDCDFDVLQMRFGPHVSGGLIFTCGNCGKSVVVEDPSIARVLGQILAMLDALSSNDQTLSRYVD